MALFDKIMRSAHRANAEDGLAPIIPLAPAPRFIFREDTDQRRPCWARGRKALFHCWANVAHPVPPRGVELNEKTRFFQFRRTDAIVEFEDGTVARCYPNEIQFADDGGFDKFDWRPMAEGGQEDGEE